jgi:hypothetical protein
MRGRAGCATLVLLLSVSSATADDAERAAMSRVRLTTDSAATRGCTHLGAVSDDSVKDLRRKIVKSGGDTGYLAFPTTDLSLIYAQVFRCPPDAKLPAGVPPPPPGVPPSPPPAATAPAPPQAPSR